MLIFALTLLSAALVADRDPPAPPAPPVKPVRTCMAKPELAAKPQLQPRPPRPETLDRLPRAEAYYSVLRIVDGCETPVKVRDYRR